MFSHTGSGDVCAAGGLISLGSELPSKAITPKLLS